MSKLSYDGEFDFVEGRNGSCNKTDGLPKWIDFGNFDTSPFGSFLASLKPNCRLHISISIEVVADAGKDT